MIDSRASEEDTRTTKQPQSIKQCRAICRALEPLALRVVFVEAFAGLEAELALGDELVEQIGRAHV